MNIGIDRHPHRQADMNAEAAEGDDLRRELCARRQSEAELECLLMLLGTVLESVADGIIVFNRQGRVVRFNQRLVELFAIPDEITAFWEHDRLVACVLSRFEDPTRVYREIAGWFEMPLRGFQMSFAGSSGRVFECYCAPQPEGVDSVGRVISFRDISERIHMQHALLQEREGKRILIGKLGDAHRQVAQYEQQASIGRLAAGMAHEINNPIGFVKSNLGRLHEYFDDLIELLGLYQQAEADLGGDSPIGRRIAQTRQDIDIEFLREDLPCLLHESLDGVLRIHRIVQDLKNFSHAGEADWQYADVHEGLDSTLGVLQADIGGAGIIKDYGSLPEIECSPGQLNQLFMHLLLNAAQAVGGKGGTITIRTGVVETKAWVEIADDGEGIAAEDLERIFEPFFTTRPAGKGTGLGLAVAASIVRQHHGNIEVHSERGRGSIFRVVLPIRQGADAERNLLESKQSPKLSMELRSP